MGPSSDLLPEKRGTDYAPVGTLPSNAENISPAAKDLLKRLLQPDPCLRLRSLLSLQRIAFYMGHDLQSYMQKKVMSHSVIYLISRHISRELGVTCRKNSKLLLSIIIGIINGEIFTDATNYCLEFIWLLRFQESPFALLGRRVEVQQDRKVSEFSNFDSSLGDSISHAEDR